MEKDELVKLLNEGLSVEEIPMISNLVELKYIVPNSNLDDSVKKKMMENINYLIKDTLKHARTFSDLVKDALK